MSKDSSDSDEENNKVISKSFIGIIMPSKKYETKFVKSSSIKNKTDDKLMEFYNDLEEKMPNKCIELNFNINFEYLNCEDIEKDDDDEHTHNVRIIVGLSKDLKKFTILKKNLINKKKKSSKSLLKRY